METSKTGCEKSSPSTSTALPGQKLPTSKRPRMLTSFEIDLLRQDLKAALALLRARRNRHLSTSSWRDGDAVYEQGTDQCQIQCQIGGLGGQEGDRNPCAFSNLLIRLILPPGSNPSLSAR